MNLLKLFIRLITGQHIHRFKTPIVSKYVGFHIRDIVYQCNCGKKELRTVYRGYGNPFPIPTTIFIEKEHLDRVLNNNSVMPQILNFEDKLKFIL